LIARLAIAESFVSPTIADLVTSDRAAATPSDAELLRAVARGDEHAYASLYHRHGADLLGLIRRILGSRAEAEDVLQEVFLQVWRHAGDYDEARGRAFRWLAVIARSRALDRRSTLDSRNRAASGAPAEETVNHAADPADEAGQAEEAEIVRQALGEIPEAQKNVLLLAYFQGLSQSEIALRLGHPLGTVKSHARLGLAKLRERIRSRTRRSDGVRP
jgi:RNA polymerase sigma-70 factor (ECF subfamily)